MSEPTYDVVKPQVTFRMYWLESTLLLLSFVTPVVAWLTWHNGGIVGRSGSITVFFAAIAEFVTINRMNRKHLLNAWRVRAQEKPRDFSCPARVVGVISLVAALLGTILWGFGDLLLGP